MMEQVIAIAFLLLVSVSFSNSIYCVSEHGICEPSFNCKVCQPLGWFVKEAQFISNDSTIIFLPGNHILNSNASVNALVDLSNKNNLTLNGYKDGVVVLNSTVVCEGEESGFLFRFSTNIHICGLTFNGCGVNVTGIVSTLHFLDSSNVSLSYVVVTDSIGHSVVIERVCGGFVDIGNSKFTRCSHSNSCMDFDNVWINFGSCNMKHLELTSLQIEESCLGFGNSGRNGSNLFLSIRQPMVIVMISNVFFLNGLASFGGNLNITVHTYVASYSKINITNSHIVNGNATRGGGVHVSLVNLNDGSHCRKPDYSMLISFDNTTFQANNATSGGAFRLFLQQMGHCPVHSSVKFHDCTFEQNSAQSAGALMLRQFKGPMYTLSNQLSIILENCVVIRNNLIEYSEQLNGDGIVSAYQVDNITIQNSIFLENNGSGLLLIASTVFFEGNTLFAHNSAPYGGAIRLCDMSLLFLVVGTHIMFESNRADVSGGAIYAGNQCLEVIPKCFYQPISNSTTENLKSKMSLTFINNTANLAGDAIYGGSVDQCWIYYGAINTPHGKVYEAIFNVPNDTTAVTSDPYGVCICNVTTQEPHCDNLTYHGIDGKYPGERFTVNVTAVGQTQGAVPALMTVTSTPAGINISSFNNKLPVTSTCQSITLAVFAEPCTNATLTVSVVETNPAKEHSNYFKRPKLKFVTPIISCPWIFEFNETTKSCDCNHVLKRGPGIKCDISSGSVYKPYASWWIDCITSNKSNHTTFSVICNEVILSTDVHCQHCNATARVFTQFNLSKQCKEGRRGRLCGGCKTNYSLSLGPPTCIESAQNCSIGMLSLLLFIFFAAGIALVCFLTIFNFTVAEGTVNGLLFFANCIHNNEDVFFQSDYTIGNYMFRVFFSWLNLDLGFQLCLYRGMTAYEKLWLEFGFLLYLLLLGVLIVCLSRKFIWFTRLVGRNVVPVLATVVLFAFPKVARNSIKTFHCDKTLPETGPFIWASDRTIDCFAGKHIPLFLVCLFLFIVAFLYTMCLLLIQCLQRASGWCVLRWVNKLRPFFEAYTGPCRDQYRFWPGLLIFVRFGVMILSEITDSKHRWLIFVSFCLLMISLALLFPRGVYKKWPLTVLDIWFFALLISIFAAATQKSRHREVGIDLCLGLSTVTFVFIFIYHVYMRINKTKLWKKFTAWIHGRLNRHRAPIVQEDVAVDENALLIRPEGMPSVIQFAAPREPLLED